MSAGTRFYALLLIAILLCVPAVTRATQSPDSARSSAPAFSFKKSVDGPRERVSVPPDLAVFADAPVIQPDLPHASPRRLIVDFPVRTSAPPASPRSLRAPPALVS